MSRVVVFGLGTGRCGTSSLASLLDAQAGAYVTHEMSPILPWNVDAEAVESRVNALVDRGVDISGDVSSTYLPHVETILSVFPSAKFVCLERPKAEVVESFSAKTGQRNHWMNHDGREWTPDPVWDPAFPKFAAKGKREAIEQYWDHYFAESRRLEREFPEAFRVFDLHRDLNSEDGVTSILDFVGVPNGARRVKPGIRENKIKGSRPTHTSEVPSSAECDVSVIVPCFNASEYLRATLESVARQSRSPREIIVVDDGSTDGSAEIAASFGDQVQVIQQANRGAASARNAGVDAASSSFILFLDADDLLHAESIERLFDTVDGREDRVAQMGWVRFDATPDQPSGAEHANDHFFPHLLRYQDGFGVPIHCRLTPTSVIRRIGGFREHLTYMEDWEFWYRVALSGAELAPTGFVGAFYRNRPGSVTNEISDEDRECDRIAVAEHILESFEDHRATLNGFAVDLFWSAIDVVRRGRSHGISWSRMEGLASRIHELIQRNPETVGRCRFPKMIRWFGLRWAYRLREIALLARRR